LYAKGALAIGSLGQGFVDDQGDVVEPCFQHVPLPVLNVTTDDADNVSASFSEAM
jgi:hypothetical protein